MTMGTKVSTTRFGEIEVPDDRVLSFPDGLIGFEENRRFTVLAQGDSPFQWMQSLDQGDLAFVIINPLVFKPDYQVVLPREELAGIGLGNEADAAIYALVVIPEDPRKMTANLLGPLVINTKNNMAKQVVLTEGAHSPRHPILPETEEATC